MPLFYMQLIWFPFVFITILIQFKRLAPAGKQRKAQPISDPVPTGQSQGAPLSWLRLHMAGFRL